MNPVNPLSAYDQHHPLRREAKWMVFRSHTITFTNHGKTLKLFLAKLNNKYKNLNILLIKTKRKI